jgi:PPOX class probable F420-dependent enzyme
LSDIAISVVPVRLTEQLVSPERETVESRLRANLMAWFTTVDPEGQPSSVPVWFVLREDDETILIYSQAGKKKLLNLAANPRVAFGLDVTDIGRSNVRIEGSAHAADDEPAADDNPLYLAKYIERIGALFGTPQRFAELFSVPLVLTPRRLMTGP